VEDPTPGEAPGSGDAVPADASGQDAQTPADPTAARDHTIRCEQCGETVPNLTYCVRCGDPLLPEQRRGREGRVRDTYAAVPGERASSVHLVSTIYPSLPREEIRTFQLALIGGAMLVAVLGILGFFPVAIAAAAVLVPLITIIYLYDVDVYEDEPIRVIALTFLWGAVTGALFAYALRTWFPISVADLVGAGSVISGGGGTPFPWVRGVIAPIAAVVIMIAGPAVLLPYKRFNDVLDGATFGVASGVAFVGAQTLVGAIDLFASGLQPAGDPLPWVVRLLVLGVGTPVIAAGARAGLGGALWLRSRAPVMDRGRLGPVGQPVVAFVVAAALMVVAALTEALLPDDLVGEMIALVVIAALAILALLWLRRVIHVGLLQEADEIPIGPPIVCPECGKETPRHTYCGHCGASLKALPRDRHPMAIASGPAVGDLRAPHVPAPEPPDITGAPTGVATALAADAAIASVGAPRRHGWLDQRAILALFAVGILAVVLIAAVIAFTQGEKRDLPPCPDPDIPCAGLALAAAAPVVADPDQPQGRHPVADRETHQDSATGFSVQYDPTLWTIAQQNDGFLVLTAIGGNVVLIFDVGRASDWSPDALLGAGRDQWSQRLLGFAEDTEPARQLLGDPILGYRDGVGGLFGGTIDTAQGPTLDMTVAIVAATDDQVTASATLLTPVSLPLQDGSEIEIRDAALQLADDVVNSFTWPADEGNQ
jgi:hypothetical protein